MSQIVIVGCTFSIGYGYGQGSFGTAQPTGYTQTGYGAQGAYSQAQAGYGQQQTYGYDTTGNHGNSCIIVFVILIV